jgi:hypothetical protein
MSQWVDRSHARILSIPLHPPLRAAMDEGIRSILSHSYFAHESEQSYPKICHKGEIPTESHLFRYSDSGLKLLFVPRLFLMTDCQDCDCISIDVVPNDITAVAKVDQPFSKLLGQIVNDPADVRIRP